MNTFYSKYEQQLIDAGYSIQKLSSSSENMSSYWQLFDGLEMLLENRRRGELLREAYKVLGE